MTCEYLLVLPFKLHTDHAQLRSHCTQDYALPSPIPRADHQHTEVDIVLETATEGHRTSGCYRVCLGSRLIIGGIKTSPKHCGPLQTPDTDG